MNNIIFYKDTFINQELAFILNIPYKYINSFKDRNNKELLFVSKEYIKDAITNKLYRGIDYITLEDICNYLNKFNYSFETGDRKNYTYSYEEIEKIPIELLSLSEMLIKVLYSKPKKINCKVLEKEANIDYLGNLWGCCPGWTGKMFGNILFDEDMYNNYRARMIRLSSLNKTYCFCHLKKCKYYGSPYLDKLPKKVSLKTLNYPKNFTISIDRRCNLRCNSCRTCFFEPSEQEKKLTSTITDRLLNIKWLNKTFLVIAGNGEVFYSPEYKKIIECEKIKGIDICIFSNGTLLTKEKLQQIENHFRKISVSISIDAATKETYNKLRHGNFDVLIKNLQNLAKHRQENKIVFLQFNYVIQKDNLNEALEFIKLARSLNVDCIQFTKLNNWNTTSEEEYINNSLLDGDCLKTELYQLLQNPIFKEKDINIESFKGYIERTKKILTKNS